MEYFLLLAYDPIAVWSLIAGVVGAVAAIVGAVAVIYAAYYAKKAPTADDLARVQDNTAHLEEVPTSCWRLRDPQPSFYRASEPSTAHTRS